MGFEGEGAHSRPIEPLSTGELDLGVLGRHVEVASSRASSLFSMRLALPVSRVKLWVSGG